MRQLLLICILFIISCSSSKIEIKSMELIVVFKKGVILVSAKKLLDQAKVTYREGMDSSRGKVYFYKTGLKFIVTFSTKKAQKSFLKKYQQHDLIYEIYEPDWNIFKD